MTSTRINIETSKDVKVQMKVIAMMTDVPISKIWEEAALSYLEGKGIILKPAAEGVDNHVNGKGK